MPCYLFTFHAYGSWMSDRRRGYVKRKTGILPRDADMARNYRDNQKESQAHFDAPIQQLMIEESIRASSFQRFTLHCSATDPSHLHDLVSWRDVRPWLRLRNGIRSSITRKLNQSLGKRHWLVESASRKRVRDNDHFDYLVNTYLPDHVELKWSKEKGIHT